MSKKVCIYCGANTGNSKEIVQQTKRLCDLLIQQDFDLVYGGGKTGLMGIIATHFLANGRTVIGVRPEKLIQDEDQKEGLTEMIVVKDMHERKGKMIALSDAFIALPGGVGTLDEIIDVYTQVKIGFLDKFCGILNVNDYYKGLEILLKNMVEFGFLTKEGHGLLAIADSPEELMGMVDKAEIAKDRKI